MGGALGSSFSVRRKINALAENALQQALARVERATIKGIDMSDSSSRATAPASVPGFVRNLGAFEEIYWLYNQLGAHGFAYAMEVDGPTIVADWRSALDAVQRSQPFFSVRIEQNNGACRFSVMRAAPLFRCASSMECQVPVGRKRWRGRSSPLLPET